MIHIVGYLRHKEEDGYFIFSNGAKLDHIDAYDKLPHSIRGAITIDDDDISPAQLKDDARELEAIAYIKETFPDAIFEMILDEYLEYIIWISEEQLKSLKL